MELSEIKSCIEVYQDFITHCTKENFDDLFKDADYCDFISKNFKTFPTENLNLFLGINNSKLVGFLVNENVNYTDWTESTEVFESEFIAFSALGYKTFKEYYEKKAIPDSDCAIDALEGFARIEAWASKKEEWFSKHVTDRTLVKYFEIPSEDYANGQGNSFNLGLLPNNQIDLIAGNPSGLYDFTRPVPPFEPKF